MWPVAKPRSVDGSLSAFAARKSQKQPIIPAPLNNSPSDNSRHTSHQQHNGLKLLSKKRKLSGLRLSTSPTRQDKAESNTPEATTIPRKTVESSCSFYPYGPRGLISQTEDDHRALEVSYEDDKEDSSSDATTIPHDNTLIHQRSNFIPNRNHVLSENIDEWTIRLRENETLALIGQYDLWIRKGAVKIMGAMLHASSKVYRVSAPSTHPLPLIHHLHNPFGPAHQPAEITIMSCRSRLHLLGNLSSKFARIWNGQTSKTRDAQNATHYTWRSFAALCSSIEDPYKRPLHVLKLPPTWQSLIAKILVNDAPRPQAVLVCGPKNSGKSTFTKFLINAILAKNSSTSREETSSQDHGVALLDLDPGQPEHSPPGDISLFHVRSFNLGPPFTHPVISPPNSKRIKAHHIGSNSAKEDPDHYLNCVLDLAFRYEQMLVIHPACPLVLNCAGWVFGTGLEVLLELIRKLRLSTVVYMSDRGPAEVVGALSTATNKAKISFHQLPSQISEYSPRTAADLRIMQVMSYFHLEDSDPKHLRWNPRPVSAMKPLVVHYTGPQQGIFGIMLLHESLDASCLTSALNGSIVGVVAVEDQALKYLDEAEHDDSGAEESSDTNIETNLTHEQELSQNCPSTATQSHASNIGYHFEKVQRINLVPGADGGSPSEPMNLTRPIPREYQGISRTPNDFLPLFPPNCAPLSPSTSHCLGQALIRHVDEKAHTIHLITPIPPGLIAGTVKIVLVKGKLDNPGWAYQEHITAAWGKRREKGKKESSRQCYEWVMNGKLKDEPWLEASTGKSPMRRSDKVWKVRRDFKLHDSAEGAMSD